MPSDADTKLQKDTLVEFDLHDCYALISLANIYCIMARDTKGQTRKRRNIISEPLSFSPKCCPWTPKCLRCTRFGDYLY